MKIKVGQSEYEFPNAISEKEEEEWERRMRDAQDKEKGIKLFLQKVCENCLFREKTSSFVIGWCLMHHITVMNWQCCATHELRKETLGEHQKSNPFAEEHSHLTPTGKICICCKGYWPMKKEHFWGYSVMRTDCRFYPDPEAFICGECARAVTERLMQQALGAWYNQMTLHYG